MRLALAALLSLAAPNAAAQGRWLDSFAVPGVFDGDSRTAVHAVVPDGAGALVAGTFRIVDDVETNGVARWTGAAWRAFGGGLRRVPGPTSSDQSTVGTAYAVVRAADGAVWVAGQFDAVVQPDGSTVSASGLARWTGAAWDVPGRLTGGSFSKPDGYSLAVAGTSVYVAGDFSDVVRPDGTTVGGGGVVRWTNGVWQSLGLRERAFALAVLPDGRLLAQGTIATPDGNGATAVEVWDGTAWQPFTGPLDSPFAVIRALLVDGGQLYVGGQFLGGRTAAGATVPSRNVIRWDGAAWQPLGRGVTGGEVNALATDATGGLLVGGRLGDGLDADGARVASPGFVRWTGRVWERRVLSEREGLVFALASAGVETLTGGQFRAIGGTGSGTIRAHNLVAVAADGGLRPLSTRTGRDGTSASNRGGAPLLAADGCGGVHVHAVDAVGPLPSGIVRTWDGTAWEPVPDGLRTAALRSAFPGGPSVVYSVNDLAAVPGSCGAFVLAGRFGGLDANGTLILSPNIVRWTGQAWQGLGRGTDGYLNAVAVSPDGAVTVGGVFTTAYQADGTRVAARNVARWTETGGWQPLGTGVRRADGSFQEGVYALLAEPGGAVTVAGSFGFAIEASGAERPARSVARWTGAAWETFGGPLGIGPFQALVSALARWQGRLVAAGDFAQVEQPGGSRIDARAVAAWDGATWSALPGLAGNTSDLAVADGELFVLNGSSFAPARWTGTAWVALSAGSVGGNGIAVSNRILYVGGAFETAGGVGSPGLAAFDIAALVSAEAPVPAASKSGVGVAPNPSRGAARLTFRLDTPGPARLVLVDALGRTVAVLAEGERDAGEHILRVDTSRLPAGVYAARLDAEGEVRSQRFTVVR